MSGRLALAAAAALVLVPCASASVTIATGASAPALRVDAAGNAEVSWTAGGRRHTALIAPDGRIEAGAALAGPDVSSLVPGKQIPFQRTIRTGPGSWTYALQAWRVRAGGPLELRFSRWRGVPTEVSLKATRVAHGLKLTGFVTGPLTGVKQVSLDAQAGGAWTRRATAPVRADGSFSRVLAVPQAARSYRATLVGPNAGDTLAPDAAMVVAEPVELDPGR